MVKSESLEFGKTYFFVGYFDYNLRVPNIETLIFVGLNLDGVKKNNQYFFQDPSSFLKKGFYKDIENNDEYDVEVWEDDMLESLYSLEDLVNELNEIIKYKNSIRP